MDLINRGLTWRSVRDRIIARFIRVSAWLSISIMFLILVFIAKEALPLFYEKDAVKEVGWGRLFLPHNYGTPDAPLSYSWHPVSTEPKYSLMPLLMGTLKVTIIAMLFSIPLSLAAAVYTAEFASKWAREVIKPVIELLAGFPSVVLGFFALIVLASWVQDLFNLDFRTPSLQAWHLASRSFRSSTPYVKMRFLLCRENSEKLHGRLAPHKRKQRCGSYCLQPCRGYLPALCLGLDALSAKP
jgi:ABC-type phosphate transport system permease subunit